MLKSLMFSNIYSLFKKHFLFNPWVYLSVFLISNTILSFIPLNLPVKIIVLVFGLLTPWAFGLITVYQEAALNTTPLDSVKVPFWLWIIVLALFSGSLFYHLTTLPFWPIPDEGLVSFLAMDQNHQWNWNPLFGESRIESLILWLLALLFKFEQPSLFSMRLFPALISMITIGIAYWAARQYFSRWFSFLFFCLLGFSFFEWTLSRMISSPALALIFLCAAFGFLGKIRKEKGSFKRNLWFIPLILCSALGFYSFTSWPVCWLSIGLCLWEFTAGTLRQKIKITFLFFTTTLLGTLPLITARLASGGMSHIQGTLTHFSPFQSYGLYFNSVFWNGLSSFPFGPLWGGYLNPLYDSLAFLGTLEIVKKKGSRTLFAILLLLFLFMTPGGLSSNIELHRVLPALILLSLLAVWGIQSLLADFNPKKIIGVSALIILSFSFDFFHFADRYCDPNFAPPGKQWRSMEYFNAYQILKNLSEQNGPIDIFTEWNPDYDDKTLNITVYPFNALENVKISQNKVSLTAFLIDMDYMPFLKKRFPHTTSLLLNPNLQPNDPHHLLGLFLIPTTDIPPAVLNQWITTHQTCEQIAFLIKNRNPSKYWAVYEKNFADLASQQTGDRFLTSVLWERAASFPLMDGDFQLTALDYQRSLQNGYPVPHLQQNFKLAAFLSHSLEQSVQKSK
jgi:hypothetical protein